MDFIDGPRAAPKFLPFRDNAHLGFNEEALQERSNEA